MEMTGRFLEDFAAGQTFRSGRLQIDKERTVCLLTILFSVHPEAPVVVAGNRDERYARPAKPLQALQPAAPRVLGGLDVLAGGTWLAVDEHGVFAGLTNRPAAGGRDPSRRSRGELPLLLAGYPDADEAVKR